MKELNYNIKTDAKSTIKALGYIQDASAKIYSLSDLTTAIWTGTVNSTGKVVDTYGNSPYLSYGDYRVVIEKCDYDTEISDFRVPDTSLVNLTIGCSSAITAHETIYDHSLIGVSQPELPPQTGNSGKYLTTNGTTPSWGTIVSGLPVSTLWYETSNTINPGGISLGQWVTCIIYTLTGTVGGNVVFFSGSGTNVWQGAGLFINGVLQTGTQGRVSYTVPPGGIVEVRGHVVDSWPSPIGALTFSATLKLWDW